MSARGSAFQGHREIAAVIERIRPLAQWLDANRTKAGEVTLTLRRRDYALLMRWPQAASLHQVWFDPSGAPHWGRYTLRPDSTEPTQNGPRKQAQL